MRVGNTKDKPTGQLHLYVYIKEEEEKQLVQVFSNWDYSDKGFWKFSEY
jgi:hypothetical protein